MEKTTEEKERFYNVYLKSMKCLHRVSQEVFGNLSEFDGGRTMGISFLLGILKQIECEFQYMYSKFSDLDDIEELEGLEEEREMENQGMFDTLHLNDKEEEIEENHIYLEI